MPKPNILLGFFLFNSWFDTADSRKPGLEELQILLSLLNRPTTQSRVTKKPSQNNDTYTHTSAVFYNINVLPFFPVVTGETLNGGAQQLSASRPQVTSLQSAFRRCCGSIMWIWSPRWAGQWFTQRQFFRFSPNQLGLVGVGGAWQASTLPLRFQLGLRAPLPSTVH